MAEYTPTEAQVRRVYSFAPANLTACDHLNPTPDYAADQFDRWLADVRREAAEKALAPIREALAAHPRCDVHPDDDPITCGWKGAVADVQAALENGAGRG